MSDEFDWFNLLFEHHPTLLDTTQWVPLNTLLPDVSSATPIVVSTGKGIGFYNIMKILYTKTMLNVYPVKFSQPR